MILNVQVFKGFYPDGSITMTRGSIILSLGLCCLLSGCAAFSSVNPATGRKEFVLFSTQDEAALGQQFHQQIAHEMPLQEQGERALRVKRIGERLVAVSDRKDLEYRFFVVQGEEWNAFTIPGGYIYVYAALLDALPQDDEVAAVVAHEIGHVAARHTIKKFQAALGYDVLKTILFEVVFDRSRTVSNLAQVGTDVLMNVVFSAYGRQDELEADRLALRYMIRAGYDPAALIRVFELLAEKNKGSWTPAFLRSHPLPVERIKQAQEWIILWKRTGRVP